MKISWSNQAKRSWYKTLQYISDEFGYGSAVKFRRATSKVAKQIQKFPKSGPVEPLLEGMEIERRCIGFADYNKMIYHVFDDMIYVDDIWDTRREPKNQANETVSKYQ